MRIQFQLCLRIAAYISAVGQSFQDCHQYGHDAHYEWRDYFQRVTDASHTAIFFAQLTYFPALFLERFLKFLGLRVYGILDGPRETGLQVCEVGFRGYGFHFTFNCCNPSFVIASRFRHFFVLSGLKLINTMMSQFYHTSMPCW